MAIIDTTKTPAPSIGHAQAVKQIKGNTFEIINPLFDAIATLGRMKAVFVARRSGNDYFFCVDAKTIVNEELKEIARLAMQNTGIGQNCASAEIQGYTKQPPIIRINTIGENGRYTVVVETDSPARLVFEDSLVAAVTEAHRTQSYCSVYFAGEEGYILQQPPSGA